MACMTEKHDHATCSRSTGYPLLDRTSRYPSKDEDRALCNILNGWLAVAVSKYCIQNAKSYSNIQG